MAYEISWYIPDQILYIKATGQIQDQDIELLRQEILHYFDQVSDSPLYLLCDMASQTSVPNLQFFSIFQSIPHRNFRWGVITGSRIPAINFTVQFWAQMPHSRLQFCKTVEAGLRYLESIEENLLLREV